jgi:hypothetical protein
MRRHHFVVCRSIGSGVKITAEDVGGRSGTSKDLLPSHLRTPPSREKKMKRHQGYNKIVGQGGLDKGVSSVPCSHTALEKILQCCPSSSQ